MSNTPDTILGFPQDIIFNILSRLPAKSLLQFRCVCTSTSPLISHPSFTKLHLTATPTTADHRTIISYDSTNYETHHHHFYFLLSPPTFHATPTLRVPYVPKNGGYRQLAGSSKGLICFFASSFHSSSGDLFLWNPIINKHKVINGPHNRSFSLGDDPTKVLWRRRNDQISLFVFGFGFVSRTCEFKVVGIVYDHGVYNENKKVTGGCSCCSISPVIDKDNSVLVYSLSTNSWEVKEGVRAPCYLARDWSRTTFVNGFVNWLGYKEDGARVIMAFDLDNEGFRVYGLPKENVPNYNDLSLNSFGEEDNGLSSLSLSLCGCYWEGNVEKWDVWVMGEYGVAGSWKKVFVISHTLIRPLLIKNEREVLVLGNNGRLKMFDAIKNVMQDLETQGRFLHAIRYTASLALLDD